MVVVVLYKMFKWSYIKKYVVVFLKNIYNGNFFKQECGLPFTFHLFS